MHVISNIFAAGIEQQPISVEQQPTSAGGSQSYCKLFVLFHPNPWSSTAPTKTIPIPQYLMKFSWLSRSRILGEEAPYCCKVPLPRVFEVLLLSVEYCRAGAGEAQNVTRSCQKGLDWVYHSMHKSRILLSLYAMALHGCNKHTEKLSATLQTYAAPLRCKLSFVSHSARQFVSRILSQLNRLRNCFCIKFLRRELRGNVWNSLFVTGQCYPLRLGDWIETLLACTQHLIFLYTTPRITPEIKCISRIGISESVLLELGMVHSQPKGTSECHLHST